MRPSEAMIDAPVGRDPNNRTRMMVRTNGGREAQTRYRVREQFRGYCLVEASPVTGRTHQLRVHFASLGHPVAGDAVYGHKSALVPRQFLHAWRLRFRHPVEGRELDLEAPLPADLQRALDELAGET
jgi:23S rRNA pseudouridine1911/1915/1917 synthase